MRTAGPRVLTLFLGAGAAAAASLPAHAGFPDAEEHEGSYLFRYFTDSQNVHVSSHLGSYDIALASGPKLWLQWNHERLLVKAIGAPPGSQEAVDAITTASRPISAKNGAFDDYTKARNEFQGGMAHRGVDVGYYVSTESDYFAQQVKGRVSRDFFKENTTVSAGGSYGWDRIDTLGDDDTAPANDERTNTHWDLVLTQVLATTTIVRLGGELNIVRGLQHNPYRNVYAVGGHVPERHPEDRHRRDFFVSLNQYIMNRSSVSLDYRYYTDDWGIDSQTIGAKLNQYVTEDVVVRYRYRYYDQTGADFYRPEYESAEGIDGFRTADYRLRPFTAHLFGSRVEVALAAFSPTSRLLDRIQLALNYERYFNDQNFSANVFEGGFVYRFE